MRALPFPLSRTLPLPRTLSLPLPFSRTLPLPLPFSLPRTLPLLLALLASPLPCAARVVTVPRRAHLDLEIGAMEGGIGVHHRTEHALDLELAIYGDEVSLHVTGTWSATDVSLPSGEAVRRDGHVDEWLRGSRAEIDGGWILSLTREGDAAIAPRTIEWRCEHGTAELEAIARGAIRCVSTAPRSALPWSNGHWSQVPIVLATSGPRSAVSWDGEGEPDVRVTAPPIRSRAGDRGRRRPGRR